MDSNLIPINKELYLADLYDDFLEARAEMIMNFLEIISNN